MTKDQLDPVCGMKVDKDQTSYISSYQGLEYFFCSTHCLESFKKNPEKYLNSQLQKQNPPSNAAKEYTCPMHPQIIQDHPGNCPICGMTLEPKTGMAESNDSEYKDMLRRFWIGLVLSIPILILEMGSMLPFFNRFITPEYSRLIQFILSTPVVLWAGWPFFERAYHSVVNQHLNMFSLIAMGVGTAYFYSVIALFFPHIFPPAFRHQGEIPIYFETASIMQLLIKLR